MTRGAWRPAASSSTHGAGVWPVAGCGCGVWFFSRAFVAGRGPWPLAWSGGDWTGRGNVGAGGRRGGLAPVRWRVDVNVTTPDKRVLFVVPPGSSREAARGAWASRTAMQPLPVHVRERAGVGAQAQ